jgi:uncharacterized MAPEG superfamily protein
MPIAFWCLVAAWLWVYLTKGPVALAMHRLGGYDNRHPRAQQAQLTGWGARAMAAHANGFEAFAPFAAAVLSAQFLGGHAGLVSGLAITFVAVRMAYTILYIADLAAVRSLVWTVGWLATLGIFVSPLF